MTGYNYHQRSGDLSRNHGQQAGRRPWHGLAVESTDEALADDPLISLSSHETSASITVLYPSSVLSHAHSSPAPILHTLIVP
jgi:hypothetical protein